MKKLIKNTAFTLVATTLLAVILPVVVASADTTASNPEQSSGSKHTFRNEV